jgi:translation initiation factor IF-2
MSKETEKKADEKTEKKTLSLGGTLSLKAAGSSSANAPASFEVKKRRIGGSTQASGPAIKPQEKSALSEAQREARVRALKQAQEQAEDQKPDLPKPQVKKRDDATEETTTSTTRAAPVDSLAQANLKRMEESGVAPRASASPSTAPKTFTKADADKDAEKKKVDDKTPTKPREDDRRRGGKITVTQVLNQDYERDRGPSMAAQRRAREKERLKQAGPKETIKQAREVVVPEAITVQDLSNRMAEKSGDVVKALMKMGMMATINQTIDADTAELLIQEFGHTIKRVTEADIEIGLEGVTDSESDLKSRPPIVTIMGHVDHGKTSLLDALRQTNVVSGEAGGITQHIGAYQVAVGKNKDKVTFIDTPGHAAFTQMRARGANITDVVILVVAANDSVMPQTIEAISHAKAAGVPLIVAINKIDLPDANPQKVKTDLLQYEVIGEDMGGDTMMVEVSAKAKLNLDKLLEAILLQAEVLELKANPDREAHGTVVEAKMEKGRGSVATVLVDNGTLRNGDIFVVGGEWGRVRNLFDDKGQQVTEAVPGQPVEVLGLQGMPEAGDELVVVKDEARARAIVDYRRRKKRDVAAAVMGATSIEQLMANSKNAKKELPVLIKADVHGSIEAITGSLNKMVEDNEELSVRVIYSGVGGITESDVTLARASNAYIVGFNVRANTQARELAQRENVTLRYYNIIYNVIDDVKEVLTGMLSPKIREELIGYAEIREVFNITKVGKIAGCMVTSGTVKKGNKVRLLRDDVVIHEGTLKTLKRFKDEVKEVREGMECGMAFEKYDDMKAGDVIECSDVIEEAQKIA